MSGNSGQWVIKSQSEQVMGPYSTEALIKMIIYGAFSGNEEVCSYPEGEWTLLTKQPEFYDALLESLENPVDVDNKRAQKMEAETVIRVPELKKIEVISEPKPESEPEPEIKNIQKILEKKVATRTHGVTRQKKVSDRETLQYRDKNLEIQLSDIKKLKQKEVKKLFPFVFLGLLVLGAAIYFFLLPEEDTRSGWFLIAVKKIHRNRVRQKK